MGAPNISTWDDTVPHRPGAPDFDGCVLTNDPVDPPIAGEMPTAEQQNTLGLTITSIGKVVPNSVISVGFPGGTPTITFVQCAPNTYDVSTMTLTRTPGGAVSGDFTIGFASSKFPTSVAPPSATPNPTIGATPTAVQVNATAVANNVINGVRVVTTLNGALADVPFTVTPR